MKAIKNFNATKFVLLLAVLLVAGSVFYYLVIFLPGKERLKVQAEQELKQLEIQSAKGAKDQEIAERQACNDEADKKADELLKDKYELNPTAEYKKAIDLGLHLKANFDKYYEQCLSTKGLSK